MSPDLPRDDPPPGSAAHPGEPGVVDRRPPFAPEDAATRWLFSLNRFGIRPGLERIEALLDALGRPERDVLSIVVAGTNGKGSTTRILDALLRAAGHRVACFTSPHLLRVYERLTIDGRPVDPALFAGEVAKLRPLVESTGASWFEALTALALDVCRDERIEVLCCETGLGGRLDASNALPSAAVLLTSVGLDHQAILGPTRAAICDEKLGLLKRGVPLFCGVDAELRPQVFRRAVAAGAPCHFLDELASIRSDGDRWRLTTRRSVLEDLPSPGSPVLMRNEALALLALEELSRAGAVRPVPDPAAALADVFLPGRWHRVLADPDWILDTAHNDQALTATLDHFLAAPLPGRRVVLFGGLREKPVGEEVGRRLAACDLVRAAPIDLERSRDARELALLLDGWGVAGHDGAVAPDTATALRRLARELRPRDTVLVTGSCFLVAEVLYRLGFRDIEETRRPVAAAGILERLATP